MELGKRQIFEKSLVFYVGLLGLLSKQAGTKLHVYIHWGRFR